MKRIIMLFILVLTLTGCSIKQNISSNDFIDLLEKENFFVTSMKSKYKNYEEIEEIYIAQNKDMTYQIEFYELSSISSAKKLYNGNIEEIKKEENISNNLREEYNYSKYIQETKDKYQVVSRIDNTLIYVNSDIKYKDEINKILDKINY